MKCYHTMVESYIVIPFGLVSVRCASCSALGVMSLGPSNDDFTGAPVELIAAAHLSDAEGHQFDVWDIGDGDIAFGSSDHLPETWPWDRRRPVVGQFEQWKAAKP